MEAIERALREAGAPLEMRFLHHPTEAGLRRALREGAGYDVLVVDTHGHPDGSLCFEGPHGENHPLSPANLGQLLAQSGVRLALLSACYSAAACDTMRQVGVPAVVGMAESVWEDAARAYLEPFLARLARGGAAGRGARAGLRGVAYPLVGSPGRGRPAATGRFPAAAAQPFGAARR